MIYEGEYLFNKKWNGLIYDKDSKEIFNIINGKGKGKEYNDDGNLQFEGEYLYGKKMGKGKNIIMMEN